MPNVVQSVDHRPTSFILIKLLFTHLRIHQINLSLFLILIFLHFFCLGPRPSRFRGDVSDPTTDNDPFKCV